MNKAPRRHDGKFPRADQANPTQDGRLSDEEFLKQKYVIYEEFEFLKIKPIRFSIIGVLVVFALFWQGAEVPDFENAPRQVTVGRYQCQAIKRSEIDDIKYYHNWTRVFGFLDGNGRCNTLDHGRILAIEWIQFRDKRVVTAITNPETGQAIAGYTRQREYLKENAASLTGVYAWRIAAMLLALLLLFKTEWKTNIQNGEKP